MTAGHTIEFSYDSVPTLRQFALSDARIRGIMGPFGSGKSSASVIELVRRATQHPRSQDGIRHSRWAVVRNTYAELRTTTIKTVMQWLPEMYFGKYVENKHTYTVKAFEGVDMEIVFTALDRPDDIAKLLSAEYTGGWVNEAREIPWSIINALDGRIGRFPPVRETGPYWHGMWLDTNPPDSDSEWYAFFEEDKWRKDFARLVQEGHLPADSDPEEYAQLFKQPSGLSAKAENLPNLTPAYYGKLAIGKSDEWVKVYVHGQYGFVLEGKLVYPEYGDAVHCRAVDPLPSQRIIRSWDYGLSPACVFSQLLPDGRWLTFDEMVSDNMSIDQFSDNVLDHCQRSFRGQVEFEDWGDPAGNQRVQTDAKTCYQIQQAKGINVESSIQDPKHRQEAVRRPLRSLAAGGEPMFILHPRCRTLRKGFMGGYHRRRLSTPGPERYSDQPEKNRFSHCFPAGTTVATPNGEVDIKDVFVGDWVHTPAGPRCVTATMNRQVDRLVRILTRDHRLIMCTPDHPFWVRGSFVSADALRYGDQLTTSAPWAEEPSIPSKNIAASAISESRVGISKRIILTAVNISTALYGWLSAARSPMVFTSTTSTKTKRTATSTTSNAYLAANTSRATIWNAMRLIPRPLVGTWRRSARRPRNGIDLTKAALGIANTVEQWLRGSRLNSAPACTAAISMKASAARESAAFAQMPVRPPSAEQAVSTMKRAAAPSAQSPLWSANTAVLEPADVVVANDFVSSPNTTVYDLTVDDAHAFYAVGILVSNCHDALQYGMAQYFGPALVGVVDSDDDWPTGQGGYDADLPRESTTGY